MGDALLHNGHRYSIPEYEAMARRARPGERYEYVRGELIPCPDEYTTDAHNQVVINACRLLGDHFYPKGCRVYTQNVRLLINEGEEYRLPDVLVTCSERDRASRDAKRDPVVLVEVLSPATALQDLAVKADSYRKIASLQAYLIVNPAQVWARLYQRSSTGEWLPDQALTDLQAGFLMETLTLPLPLADLYRFVL